MGSKKNIRILISGGGTGGHIYPAIAIADSLKLRFPEASFLFVGAKGKMEMEKVPAAGYGIKGLWIAGFQRRLTVDNLMFPIKLISSLINAFLIFRKFKPDLAIGTGGYASGPMLFVASFNKVPSLIQEQNSYPGVTNRILAEKVAKICVAYDGLEKYFPKEKIVKTGNPIRQDLLQISKFETNALTTFNINKSKKVLLVVGGSLGAKKINELIAKHHKFILSLGYEIVWQTGKIYFGFYQHLNEVSGMHVYQFIHKMHFAFACADVIISRAGAGIISELCVVGKPVVLIPSPNVAEDHQTKNAQALVDREAAILLQEKELNQKFESVFKQLSDDEQMRAKLAENIKSLALSDATENIVNEAVKILK